MFKYAFVVVLLTSLASRVNASPCHHGIVCVKQPGPDLLLEARTGYAFMGTARGAAAEANIGFGNLRLGIPENIVFIGEFGFTAGDDGSLLSESAVRAFDIGAGVRAYLPTQSRFTVFGDLLFGAANHQIVQMGGNSPWTFMGQLSFGMEMQLYGNLFLTARGKATFFGPGGVLLVAAVAKGDPSLAIHANQEPFEIEAVRLGASAGLSLNF